MTQRRSFLSTAFALAFFIIVLDQAVKLLVHETMPLGPGGEIPVFGDFFKLHYTLNPGMAFGLELGSDYGKLSLSLFRLVAVVLIAVVLRNLAKNGEHRLLLVSVALILGGAAGNVVDSTFYGVFIEGNAPLYIDEPPMYPWFHGQVIDMFYVDIWKGRLDESWPIVGGHYYSFWPIFNVADAAIFVGVFVILFNQKRFFAKHKTVSQAAQAE